MTNMQIPSHQLLSWVQRLLLVWLMVTAIIVYNIPQHILWNNELLPQTVIQTDVLLPPQQFVMPPPPTVHVHAATMAIVGKQILAAWFGGSSEGGTDVSIYGSWFDQQALQWSPVQLLVSRDDIAERVGRYVKKLGNPVLFTDAQHVYLGVVAVSLGGWSGSSITVLKGAAQQQRIIWQEGGTRLTLSPFINVSTLVRNPPIALTSGWIFPVYHELITTSSQAVHLSADFHVKDKQRMATTTSALQPALTQHGNNQLYAWSRNGSDQRQRHVLTSHYQHGRWQAGASTTMRNPNSAVAGLPLNDTTVLLAGNDQYATRTSIDLVVIDVLSGDMLGKHTIATGKRLGYPALLRGSEGIIHILYSDNRSKIVHQLFSTAWVATWTS